MRSPQAASFWRIQVILYFDSMLACHFGELLKNCSDRILREELRPHLIDSAEV